MICDTEDLSAFMWGDEVGVGVKVGIVDFWGVADTTRRAARLF